MSEFYMVLTNVGLAKLANAQISNSTVNLTQLAVGDGNGSYYTPSQTATALKKEVWRGPIASVAADINNPNWLNIEGFIPATAGGFTIRELGIFDGDGNLFAIGKVPETYKPVLSQGSTKDLSLKAILEIANTSNVTMVVDPNVIVASRKYVDDKTQIFVTNLTSLQEKFTQHSGEIASPSELGHVKIGQGLTISEDGTLNAEAQAVPNASTTIAGITKLNDSLTSTSTSEAATTNAAKKLNDAKLNRAGDTMTGDLTINKGIPRVYLQVPGVDYTTEFRNNASPTNDFGFDIYRKNIRALHISPSGAVWVRDNAGVEFNLGDLKSSVSNGKSAIASAISDGGVYTSPIASFADMANNIRQLASSGYKMATGSSPNVQVVLDVPAGTFGFTPKVILTRALGSAYLWSTQYIKADAFYPGSVGMGETSARDLSGSTDYVDETYGSTVLRVGGFRINATTANTYPAGGTAVTWWAFG